jgi:hypothetical protein
MIKWRGFEWNFQDLKGLGSVGCVFGKGGKGNRASFMLSLGAFSYNERGDATLSRGLMMSLLVSS